LKILVALKKLGGTSSLTAAQRFCCHVKWGGQAKDPRAKRREEGLVYKEKEGSTFVKDVPPALGMCTKWM
jgi:hypothetical protein